MQKHGSQATQPVSDKPLVYILKVGGGLVAQSYENTKVIAAPADDNAPAFFNEQIASNPPGIYICLDKHSSLASADAVEKIVDVFLKNRNIPCIIYTDVVMIDNGVGMPTFLPAFSQEDALNNIFNINHVLVFDTYGGHIPPNPFNDKLESIYYFDFFMRMSTSFILTHIAEPLCTIDANRPVSQQDIQLLNEQSRP